MAKYQGDYPERIRAFHVTHKEEASSSSFQARDFSVTLGIVTCERDGSNIRNPSDWHYQEAEATGRIPEKALRDIEFRAHATGFKGEGWHISYDALPTYWNTYNVDLYRAEEILKTLKSIKRFMDRLEERGYRPKTYRESIITIGQALDVQALVVCDTSRGWSYADNSYRKYSVTDGATYCVELFNSFFEANPLPEGTS